MKDPAPAALRSVPDLSRAPDPAGETVDPPVRSRDPSIESPAILERDALPVAVMRMDRRLHPLQANSAWRGLAEADPMSNSITWLRLFDAAERRRVRERLHIVLETGRNTTFDVRGGEADQWLEVRVAPTRDREGLVLVALDISEQKRREVRLNLEALHDPLTGLHNRIALEEHTQLALARLARRPSIVALLYVDLDDFKEVNDRHGHKTGDHVLVLAAHRLRVALRPADMLARVGGDEFVAVCESLQSPEEARSVSRRLIESLQTPIRISESTTVRIGASIGIAFATALTQHPSTLIDRADSAMYLAKRDGGGAIRVSGDDSSPDVVDEPPSPDPSKAVTKAVVELTRLEAELAAGWAGSLEGLDPGRRDRWSSASHHLAEAIAVLRGTGSDPDVGMPEADAITERGQR